MSAAPALKKETKGSQRIADKVDKYELYEKSVQDVEFELEFFTEVYEEIRGSTPFFLREDFCSTALLATSWVQQSEKHQAIGVDIDPEPLAWWRANRHDKLSNEEKSRILMVQEDVLKVSSEPVDIVAAGNFSYWCFQERAGLRSYFEQARGGLKDGGLLILDAYGGSDALEESKEKKKVEKFKYIWEQVSFDPVSNNMKCAIHFKFSDGSSLENAFTYDWRLWSLPEIQELLYEAGFSAVHIYWEDEDEDGDGSGEYSRVVEGTNDAVWIAYIVAEK